MKPTLDGLLTICFLIFGGWLFLCVLVLQLCVTRGRPFFVQLRVGRGGELFKMYKFKSIFNGKVTPFGRWLRKRSLDELPQIINILKGEMSWIGPRPLLPEYLPYYRCKDYQRLQVKPGITGLTQVKGANALNWKARFNMDTIYVRKLCLFLDLIILSRTIRILFSGREEHESMPLRQMDLV